MAHYRTQSTQVQLLQQLNNNSTSNKIKTCSKCAMCA